ncbi:MAG: hypothetical protein JWN40_5876 [Phycisphaerales bacterium]|nr:hypothetical protein [Phycisphaerales bacterium]
MRRRPRGYVLIMVLGLLVLSTTLLVSVSRLAGRAAVAARSTEDDLQRRWGVASCRKAVLPHVEPILSALEQERRRPAASYAVAVKLGGMTFDMILADEQAKANVNAILSGADLPLAETRIRQGLSGSGMSNRIKLRATIGGVLQPIRNTTTAPAATQPIWNSSALAVGGWGQVFDGVPAVQLVRPLPGSRIAPVDLMTCWGNGAMNIRRASDTALGLAAGRSLTAVEINRLVEARDKLFDRRASEGSFDQSPADRLQELMTKAAGESLKNKGNFALSETSSCHSLWVISRNGRRDGYDLFVSDEADAKRPAIWSFSW